MGSRRLLQWIKQPLLNIDDIGAFLMRERSTSTDRTLPPITVVW
jgi:DNA mismatch repair ATPase MutS